MTRWTESPEARALDGRGNFPWIWPAREASEQEGRSEIDRTSRRRQQLWVRGYVCATVGAVDEQTVWESIESQKCDEDVEGFKITAPESP